MFIEVPLLNAAAAAPSPDLSLEVDEPLTVTASLQRRGARPADATSLIRLLSGRRRQPQLRVGIGAPERLALTFTVAP